MDGPSYNFELGRWAHFTRPPAACDSDIFHHITVYIHNNMHAIAALIVNRAVRCESVAEPRSVIEYVNSTRKELRSKIVAPAHACTFQVHPV